MSFGDERGRTITPAQRRAPRNRAIRTVNRCMEQIWQLQRPRDPELDRLQTDAHYALERLHNRLAGLG